jgi:thiol-disulfide isomerase/thioredoxin
MPQSRQADRLRRSRARVFNRRSRRTVAAIGLVALAGALTAGLLIAAPAHPSRPAPALPRAVLHAPAVTLATLRGHAAMIVFWASWCGPCHTEAPAIERFALSPAGAGHVVALSESGNLTNARKFIAQYHWTFPVLNDPAGVTSGQFGVLGLPTTVVLNGKGQIVRALLGAQTVHSLAAAIAAA